MAHQLIEFALLDAEKKDPLPVVRQLLVGLKIEAWVVY
jgi:hypothetical protein